MASDAYDRSVIEHFKQELRQFQDALRIEKEKHQRTAEEHKAMCTIVDDWKKIVKQKDGLIDAQAAEIRKLQEDYKKEMESVDKMLAEHDEQMKSLYIMLDNYKSQLQAEQMSKIDLHREVMYLQQFQLANK